MFPGPVEVSVGNKKLVATVEIVEATLGPPVRWPDGDVVVIVQD
jgi:hypothetical protein